MKKKIIIPIIVCLVIVIGIIGFIIWNNRTVSTITLDINPSIEINLDRNEKVKSIIALNDDAKDILDDNYKGKSLDDTFEILISNLIEKGYVDNENNLDVILYVDGKITNKMVSEKIEYEFGKKGIHTEIVIIESVTKEDEELAKKYNVSPAKIAYVKSIIQDNDNITLENLVNDSVSELKETKETGKYCDEGYTLEGDWCLKEIDRVKASEGEKCPNGYEEYKGICYQLGGFKFTGEYKCTDDRELSGNECIKKIVSNAVPQYSCSSGELMKKGDVNPIGSADNDTLYCIDKSTGKPPTLRCLNNSGHIMVGGKCYNGPAPTINGGCPNGDLLRNGKCYSMDDEDQWECPDGAIYQVSKGGVPKLCPDTLTYSKPTINGYHCDDDRATLDNGKCTFVDKVPAEKIYACSDEGFTLVSNDKCLNYNNTLPKENGFVCEGENTRLKGNQCITYEMIEAKHN